MFSSMSVSVNKELLYRSTAKYNNSHTDSIASKALSIYLHHTCSAAVE